MNKPKASWLRRLFADREQDVPSGDEERPPALPADAPWAAGGSDRGRLRENNEDAFLCDPGRGLFTVADGMGGHMSGEQASAVGVHTLGEFLTSERIEQVSRGEGGDMQGLLAEGLQRAHAAVVDLAAEHPDWGRIGSTVVVAILTDGVLHVANLGDSRAYLVRGGELQVLTRDHSIAAALLEQGQLSAEEARDHPLRNQLTGFLGMPKPIAPAYVTAAVQSGDRIVLCSDGLWDMLPDDEIARLALRNADPRDAVEELINAANAAGGLDNITAIVAAVKGWAEQADARLEADTTPL